MKGATAVNSTYEHLSAEERRLELERVRDELLSTKKQLAERDAELVQLKTAHRKLQDVLRKKDKDLQNVFSVLRAPQDAELTKKRRTELVERLLMETQQRVANAEAVADERKRELDKLKFSSKFLRFQELDTEIDECHNEIQRLRAQLSQFVVVGKLKIAKRDGAAVGGSGKPVASTFPSMRRHDDTSSNQRDHKTRLYCEQTVTPIVQRAVTRLNPGAAIDNDGDADKTTTRATFVERTRRRAVEAEYQKQVRLAQLEAECELDENMRILAKREAAAQAEKRRQQSRLDRRSSRTERVEVATAVKPRADSVGETPSDSLGAEAVVVDEASTCTTDPELATVRAEEDTPTTAPGESTTAAAVGPVGIQSGDSKDADIAVTTVASEGEISSPDLVVVAVDTEQPQRYDEDGSDGGFEEDEDENVVVVASAVLRHAETSNDTAIDIDELETVNETTERGVDPQANGTMDASDEEPLTEVGEFDDEDKEPDVVRPGTKPQEALVTEEEVTDDDVVADDEEMHHGETLRVDPITGSGDAPMDDPEADDETVDETEPLNEKPIVPAASAVLAEDSVSFTEAAASPQVANDDDGGAWDDATEKDDIAAKTDTDETRTDDARKEDTQADSKQEEDVDPTGEGTGESEYSEDTPRSDEGPEPTGLPETAAPTPLSSPVDPLEVEAASSSQTHDHVASPVDSPIAEETAQKAETANEEPEETAAQTLHACDDVIDAASALIHRQIDTALAESVSIGANHTPTTSALASTTDLSPLELAHAMDTAARKIQQFWRDMDAKFATPRPPLEPSDNVPVSEVAAAAGATVDDAPEEEGVELEEAAATPECVESPVVSDTDAAGDDDDDAGW